LKAEISPSPYTLISDCLEKLATSAPVMKENEAQFLKWSLFIDLQALYLHVRWSILK
jgi:hypothetical protein